MSMNTEVPRHLRLSVNGAATECESGLNLAALLEAHGLATRRVAVERNGAIVPRSRHRQTLLADGDRIEIVVAVGGG